MRARVFVCAKCTLNYKVTFVRSVHVDGTGGLCGFFTQNMYAFIAAFSFCDRVCACVCVCVFYAKRAGCQR